jgi:hypothetical protein
MGKNPDPGSGINIPDPQHCPPAGLSLILIWEGWLIRGQRLLPTGILLQPIHFPKFYNSSNEFVKKMFTGKK